MRPMVASYPLPHPPTFWSPGSMNYNIMKTFFCTLFNF